MSEISNQPLSEQFRLIGKQWAELDAAARMREEGKTTFLSSLKSKLIEADAKMSETKAERIVKSGDEWRSYLADMIKDRNAANKLKIDMEYLRMRHSEQQSIEATARAERRL
jgi:hypothetical protein